MTDLDLAPTHLPRAMLAEIAIRLAIAVFLAWAGWTDPDGGLVLAGLGLAALYHLGVAVLLVSYRSGAATSLRADRNGVRFTRLGRRRLIPWGRIRAIGVQAPQPLRAKRAGVVLSLGDQRGVIESVFIPDVFAQPPAELAASLEQWR